VVTSAYFLTLAPSSATAPSKQMVTMTRYVGGLTDTESP
jgi:hypothetical protein